MDDTIVIIKRTKLEETHYLINNILTGIKFTREEENHKQLPFRSVRVEQMTNGEFQTTVYRKATHTEQVLNFQRNHPNIHKQNCLRTLFKRAAIHCNTLELHKKEEEHLYKVFTINGYPTNFICRRLLDRQHQEDTIRPNTLATL
eukprot:g36115.t1